MKKLFTAVMLLMVVMMTAQETSYVSDTMSYWEYVDDIEQWEQIDISTTFVQLDFNNNDTVIKYVDGEDQVLLNHKFIDTYVNTGGRIINLYHCEYNDVQVVLTIDDLGDVRVKTDDTMVMFHSITRITERNGLDSLH